MNPHGKSTALELKFVLYLEWTYLYKSGFEFLVFWHLSEWKVKTLIFISFLSIRIRKKLS